MRFYSRKAPQKKTEMLIDRISTGHCDDLMVSELKVAVSEFTDPMELERVLTALMDIAMKSGNPVSVAYAIKSLIAFRPLTAGLEDDLEKRAAELNADKAIMANKQLQEAMAEFLYIRISERVDRAHPFIGTLALCLENCAGKSGTEAYNTLMMVAANRPEFFEHQTGPLIRMLGSINNVTRIQSSKIIAVLAMSHPEYVAQAEKTLLHLSSFNPDGELKNAASEAHQILASRLSPEEKGLQDDSARRHRYEQEREGGLAEIMRRRMGKDKKLTYESRIDKRLLSLATNFARKADRAYKIDGETQAEFEETEHETINKIMDDFSEIAESIKAEAQPNVQPAAVAAAEAAPAVETDSPEEAELRKMMERVQDDFSITAGSILDAIGMGHLAKQAMMDDVKPRSTGIAAPPGHERRERLHERPKRTRIHRPDLVRATHVYEKPPAIKKPEEEKEISPKEFIASIESIINRTDDEMPAQTTAPGPFEGMPASMAATGRDNPAADYDLDVTPGSPEDTIVSPDGGEITSIRTPPDPASSEKPATVNRPDEPEKRARPPIVPAGVRISAMKFKSNDQSKSKKPAPAKISIKPHIKPLTKQPVDASKSVVPPMQHQVPGAPDRKADGIQGHVPCHSCGAKMPEESQRCAICGSDLKAPKIRCRKCGEINPRQGDKCTRCGSAMDE